MMGTLKKVVCPDCGCDTTITYLGSCDGCKNNWIFDCEADEYVEEVSSEDAGFITMVENDGECKLGTSHGEGCYLICCANCEKTIKHIPLGYE